MNSKRNKSSPFSTGTWIIDRLNIFFYFRRGWRVFTKRWGVLVVAGLAGLGIAYYVASKTPNVYSASSRIGIAPRIQTSFSSQAQYLEELNNFYDGQLQYMTSSKVMERVGEKMRQANPNQPPPGITTSAVKNPGSFSMVVESTDRGYARSFVSIWAQEFIAFKRELRENAIGRTAASTREEILRCERNLDQARGALLQFQRKHNIGSIKESGDAAQQRLDKLESEYQDIKTLRQRLEAKTSEEIASGLQLSSGNPVVDHSKAGTSTVQPGGADPLARFDTSSKYGELKLRLKTRFAEKERFSTTLKPRHPYFMKLAQEIRQIEEELRFQLDLIEEKRMARIKSLQEDEQSYRPLIDDLRNQVLASRNIQYEFERLQEDETNIKGVLDNLRKSEESLTSTTIDEGLFHIIEEGVGSDRPVRPNRAKMALAGLVLGLGIGLAIVYLLGRLDDRFELAEEIEAALEEPILGQIPQVDPKLLPGPRPLVTGFDEQHLFPESLRNVRSTILLGSNAPKKVLLFSSAVPGDGKTTVTVNFGFTLALAGARVLLVDADLRRGDTHNFFERTRDPGLSDVLAGRLHWTEVLQDTPCASLHVIHTGKLPPNPGELLAGPVMSEFVAEARSRYDYVLIDCPPLTAIDDTFHMTSVGDGLLFVVRSGQTSMRFARNCLETVRQRGGSILGIILNGITADNPYYYYKNYYYSYYAAEKTDGAPTSRPAVRMATRKPTITIVQPPEELRNQDSIERDARGGENS
jgi:capsular exopolysaccharide synthesis family protein